MSKEILIKNDEDFINLHNKIQNNTQYKKITEDESKFSIKKILQFNEDMMECIPFISTDGKKRFIGFHQDYFDTKQPMFIVRNNINMYIETNDNGELMYIHGVENKDTHIDEEDELIIDNFLEKSIIEHTTITEVIGGLFDEPPY